MSKISTFLSFLNLFLIATFFFLRWQGHINEIGQEIVAGAVIEYFRSKQA